MPPNVDRHLASPSVGHIIFSGRSIDSHIWPPVQLRVFQRREIVVCDGRWGNTLTLLIGTISVCHDERLICERSARTIRNRIRAPSGISQFRPSAATSVWRQSCPTFLTSASPQTMPGSVHFPPSSGSHCFGRRRLHALSNRLFFHLSINRLREEASRVPKRWRFAVAEQRLVDLQQEAGRAVVVPYTFPHSHRNTPNSSAEASRPVREGRKTPRWILGRHAHR